MKNSVKDDGAEKAIELGLDDLEAITGGLTFEEKQEKIALLSTVAKMASDSMKEAYARNEKHSADRFDKLFMWALDERAKVIQAT